MSTVRLFLILGSCALAFGGACNGHTDASGKGSETNWLAGCGSDADCSVGTCVCGVCTKPCDASSACPGGSEPDTCAANGTTAFQTLCGTTVNGPAGICVSGCGNGAACAAGFTCTDGTCLPKTGSVTSGVSALPSGTFLFLEDTMMTTAGPQPSGKCLPVPLLLAPDKSVPCVVLRVSTSACDCSGPGLAPADPKWLSIARRIFRDGGVCDAAATPPCDSECVCEIQPFAGADRDGCMTGAPVADGAAGYCYIDPFNGLGSPDVVKTCPANEKQVLRFDGTALDGSWVFACDDHVAAPDNAPGLGSIGAACTPNLEHDPMFPGYQAIEVGVETGSADCATGVCLVNHFQGRVTCPYGQDPPPSTPSCFTPDAARQPVMAQVSSQLLDRLPDQAVYCSCRCDGPDPSADYCACPTGFECAPLVDDVGLGQTGYAGSYCVKSGTAVANPQALANGALCSNVPGQCGP